MRTDHEFQFKASEIAAAAGLEAAYHEQRQAYWTAEFDSAFGRVEETIGAKVKKQQVTGGARFDVVIDYGDMTAYRRMIEAQDKMQQHRVAAEQFRSDEKVYGTQAERVYELGVNDVHYYRLGGGRREDVASVAA